MHASCLAIFGGGHQFACLGTEAADWSSLIASWVPLAESTSLTGDIPKYSKAFVQDEADELLTHTVKDHIYDIFQKLSSIR